MRKQFATLLITFFLIQTSLTALDLELNASYDYFRGLPEGSWNGNNGALIAVNFSETLCNGLGAQLGGSYGLYNWDGHENLVFRNPKKVEEQTFLTGGVYTSLRCFNAGLVYDRQHVKHLGIYDRTVSLNQLRFQLGYQFCREEIGIWGTANLTTAHVTALGVPLRFQAISQLNFFWTHYFCNCASTTLWIGAPYKNSLRFHHRTAGEFIAGFAFRAPLTSCLFVDAHGMYMKARHLHSGLQSRNYAANICVGITYVFGGCCENYRGSYLPVANNSNFLIDTNINQ